MRERVEHAGKALSTTHRLLDEIGVEVELTGVPGGCPRMPSILDERMEFALVAGP